MSLFGRRSRPTPERRNNMSLLEMAFGARQFTNYADIDVRSVEASLQVTAVQASVDLLTSLASELPLNAYRGTGSNRKQIPLPGSLEDPAGSGYGLEDFIAQCLVSWLLRGNLYAELAEAGPTGTLRQVIPFHPDRVKPYIHPSTKELVWTVNGTEFPAGKMLHRRVNPIPGVLLGQSVITAHASKMNVNLMAQAYGGEWFRNGAHPSGILSNSELDLSQPVAQTVKERFVAALRGSSEPLVLGRGWDYKAIQVAPGESQFLETQKFTAAECARLFGPGVAEVLGYESGGSLTYTSMVDRDLALLKYAANRWLRRIERLLSEFLPKPQYVEFDRDAFLETNALQRWQVQQLQLSTGSRTINEVRDREGWEPVKWGDEPMALKAAPAAAPAPAGQGDNKDTTDPGGAK